VLTLVSAGGIQGKRSQRDRAKTLLTTALIIPLHTG